MLIYIAGFIVEILIALVLVATAFVVIKAGLKLFMKIINKI